ncbi:MAG: hypothetical protein ABR600_10920 [Actinomycetota bacterium]
MIASIATVLVVGGTAAVVAARDTEDPGRTLLRYYDTVTGGDCDAALRFLTSSLRERTEEKNFCVGIHGRPVPPDVRIRSVRGLGEWPRRFAVVVALEEGSGAAPHPLRWKLVREDGSWRIARFPGWTNAGCPCPGV